MWSLFAGSALQKPVRWGRCVVDAIWCSLWRAGRGREPQVSPRAQRGASDWLGHHPMTYGRPLPRYEYEALRESLLCLRLGRARPLTP